MTHHTLSDAQVAALWLCRTVDAMPEIVFWLIVSTIVALLLKMVARRT